VAAKRSGHSSHVMPMLICSSLHIQRSLSPASAVADTPSFELDIFGNTPAQ
jgi:hypothetical protein